MDVIRSPHPRPLLEGEGAADATVRYFDGIAAQYSALYRQRTPGSVAFRLRRRRVLELFDRPGGDVLDVGCGSGVMVEALLARGCAFWGIDPAPGMIQECERAFGHLPQARFRVGAAEAIPHPDDRFDAVLCMGVVERVRDNAGVLRELIRVLKPGGTLLVTLPNRLNPYYLWRDFAYYPALALARPLYYRLARRAAPAVIPGHTLYSAPAYAAACRRHGCDVLDIAYCGFNTLVPPFDSLFPRLAVAALEKGDALRHTFLRRLGACIIVKARKQMRPGVSEPRRMRP